MLIGDNLYFVAMLFQCKLAKKPLKYAFVEGRGARFVWISCLTVVHGPYDFFIAFLRSICPQSLPLGCLTAEPSRLTGTVSTDPVNGEAHHQPVALDVNELGVR